MKQIKSAKASFEPYDIIRWRNPNGGYRVWQVLSNSLGGTHQECVIGLRTLDLVASSEACGDLLEMFVPRVILEAFVERGDVAHYPVNGHAWKEKGLQSRRSEAQN